MSDERSDIAETAGRQTGGLDEGCVLTITRAYGQSCGRAGRSGSI